MLKNLVILKLSDKIIIDEWSGWSKSWYDLSLCIYSASSYDNMQQFLDPMCSEDSDLIVLQVGSKLKVLNLKGSKFLTRTFDFFGCLNLDRLTIRDCENLDEIDRSIGKLEQLKCLKIKWCPRLKDLPLEIGRLSSLRAYFNSVPIRS